MYIVNLVKCFAVATLLLVLAACGDGGGSVTVSDPDLDMSAPKILSQRPAADGSASIDVVVALTFDEEIDPDTVFDDTIQVTGPNGLVEGTVTYDPSLKQLSFLPDDHLLAFTSYQVDLSGVTDSYGNPLEGSHNWSFTTIFDQLPPELPEF